eukprot:15331806-Ditylum_brightwellii.AAC.1
MDFLPASVHDDAEVLLEKLHRRGEISISTNDATDLFRTESFCILSSANENNQVLQKGVSSVTSVSIFMPCSNGTDIMVSARNVDTAQNSNCDENLNKTLENAVFIEPTAANFFESAGFSAQHVLGWKNSNCSNNNSLQDAVECTDFLDTIEFNDYENLIGVDLDAVNKNLV